MLINKVIFRICVCAGGVDKMGNRIILVVTSITWSTSKSCTLELSKKIIHACLHMMLKKK